MPFVGKGRRLPGDNDSLRFVFKNVNRPIYAVAIISDNLCKEWVRLSLAKTNVQAKSLRLADLLSMNTQLNCQV